MKRDQRVRKAQGFSGCKCVWSGRSPIQVPRAPASVPASLEPRQGLVLSQKSVPQPQGCKIRELPLLAGGSSKARPSQISQGCIFISALTLHSRKYCAT